MSGQAKCGVKGANGIATAIAAGGVIIFALDHLIGLVQAVIWTVIAVAALCTGTMLGYAWVRLWLPGRRERIARLAATATLPPPRPRRPVGQSQQQAIPAGNVTHNYGHTLALPADWSPEQIRAFRGE